MPDSLGETSIPNSIRETSVISVMGFPLPHPSHEASLFSTADEWGDSVWFYLFDSMVQNHCKHFVLLNPHFLITSRSQR